MMLKVSDYNYLKKYFHKCADNFSKNNFHKKMDLISKDKKNYINLNDKGYCVLRNVFEKKYINEIKKNFDNHIKDLRNISIPRDLRFQKKNIEQINLPKLDAETFLSGEKYFRNYVDSIKLKDPLINIPKILNIALNKRILSICSNYFGYLPYLTFIKCVKTYANKLKEHDTQHFHIDENALKLLKIFVYLNDVNSVKDGPFYYIQNSFKNIENKWGQKARWNEKYLKKIYGDKNFVPLLAKKGDVIIANTVAFHRGIKPINKDRNIIILNYGLHLDFTFNNKLDLASSILKKDFKKQSERNQDVLALLKQI